MVRSRSPPRSRSRERLSRPKQRHSSSSPSRSVAGSSESRSRSRSRSPSRSRSESRSGSRSPLTRGVTSSPAPANRKQQQTLRRGDRPQPRSPQHDSSRSRSPKRRRHSSSRSPARRRSSASHRLAEHGRHVSPVSKHDRHTSPGNRSRHYGRSNKSRSPERRTSPDRRSSRQRARSRSRDSGKGGSSRDRRDSGREARDSSRERWREEMDRSQYRPDFRRNWQGRGPGQYQDSRWDHRQQRQQQRYPEAPRYEAGDTWGRDRADAPAAAGGGYYRGDESARLPPRASLSDEPPAIGSIHPGIVHTVKPFGVFVATEGYRKHVLIHHTQVSDQVMLTRSDDDDMKVKALEFAAAPGQKVWVKILEVSPDQSGPGFRVHGSMLVVDQDSGQDLDPSGQMAAARGTGQRERLSDEPPEVGTCHCAEVKRIEAYGVFVALQGYRRYGLVHASQVANYLEFSAEDNDDDRKKALSEVVELGQQIWVKVVEVTDLDNPRGPKIGCSMKLVDQSEGTDLDPQNMRYRPRGDASFHPQGKAPIGASAGEVKGGTVDWGYLATRPNAFGSAGYDLLGDEQDKQQAGPSGPGRPQAQPQQQQQQQYMPPVGRGRGAVMPAWMTAGPAAPGSRSHREEEPDNPAAAAAAAANLTLEEALRIVQAASGKKKHKDKHKKHKKHKKSSKSHKKSHKHSKDKRGHSSGSGSSSDSGSSGGRR